jgi:glutathione S-transferase
MGDARLTIASKNYGAWSLRGWLLCKMAGLDFTEEQTATDDPSVRAELLLLSPSFLVPCLTHAGLKIWDTLAIGEYLNELCPDAGLIPRARVERARCRSISGEMHSGFSNLRSALPMNLKARHPGFKVWTRFVTYDVKLDRGCADYCSTIMNMPAMKEWIASATAEPDELEELDVEF